MQEKKAIWDFLTDSVLVKVSWAFQQEIFFLQKDPATQLPSNEEKLYHNQVFPMKPLHFGICLTFYIIFTGKETIVFKKTVEVMLRLQHTVLLY